MRVHVSEPLCLQTTTQTLSVSEPLESPKHSRMTMSNEASFLESDMFAYSRSVRAIISPRRPLSFVQAHRMCASEDVIGRNKSSSSLTSTDPLQIEVSERVGFHTSLDVRHRLTISRCSSARSGNGRRLECGLHDLGRARRHHRQSVTSGSLSLRAPLNSLLVSTSFHLCRTRREGHYRAS